MHVKAANKETTELSGQAIKGVVTLSDWGSSVHCVLPGPISTFFSWYSYEIMSYHTESYIGLATFSLVSLLFRVQLSELRHRPPSYVMTCSTTVYCRNIPHFAMKYISIRGCLLLLLHITDQP